MIVNDAGIYRAFFADLLSPFRPGHDWRPALNEGIELGFGGFRVFCGDLTWNGQTAELAREHLPALLQYGKERGAYFECVGSTDTGGRDRDYVERHLRAIARACIEAGNAMLEGGNEIAPVHGTQRHDIQDICLAFRGEADAMGLLYCPGSVHSGEKCRDERLWTVGQKQAYEEARANGKDEPPYWDEISAFHGSYGTSHLQDRDDVYDGERRARELENSSRARGVPWFGNEQRGAGETEGRRSTNRGLFFAQGANARAFELHRTFHSQDGLLANRLGPIQRECAQAFIRGTKLAPLGGLRMAFKSAHHADSPVSVNLDHVMRATSALDGQNDFVLLIGITGEPKLRGQHGYRIGELLGDYGGARAYRLEQ